MSINVSVGMQLGSLAVPKGRPREFDIDKALDRAMKVFWRKGYEGASLPDLTKAMRINRPSLYAAFGDKEALFRKALDRYAAGPADYIRQAMEAPTARSAAEQLLAGAIDLLTDPRNPRGCLAVQGALACGEKAEGVRRELVMHRAAAEDAIRRRLERAIRERDLPAAADPAGLARYLAVVVFGMTVQAAGGAGREELCQVADTAMRAWPRSKGEAP